MWMIPSQSEPSPALALAWHFRSLFAGLRQSNRYGLLAALDALFSFSTVERAFFLFMHRALHGTLSLATVFRHGLSPRRNGTSDCPDFEAVPLQIVRRSIKSAWRPNQAFGLT